MASHRPKSCGWQSISNQVDPEQLDGNQSLGHSKCRSQKDADDFTDVGRDQIANELLHVVVDGTAFLNCSHDRREVVISKHHLRRCLGDCRARTHRDTDLRFLQRWRIIHSVTRLNTYQRGDPVSLCSYNRTMPRSISTNTIQYNKSGLQRRSHPKSQFWPGVGVQSSKFSNPQVMSSFVV